MSKIAICDIEAEQHPYYGNEVGAPQHPDNYVVCVGYNICSVSDREGTGPRGEYFNSKDESSNWASFLDDPEVTFLVAHNSSYEMSWLLNTQRDRFMAFLKRGGRVFCTSHAEYLLSNFTEMYPSLDTTAPKYGGSHKADAVKILWEQGYRTSQIDKDLLFDQYLIGPEGDIANTTKVFWGQYDELQRRGMWEMCLLRNEGAVFNAMCMDSGLHVDLDVAMALKAKQEARIVELQEVFKKFRQDIPDYVEFKDSSDYHMSAWLFGGPIKYEIRDVWLNDDGTPKYEKGDFYKVGESLVAVLANESAPKGCEVYKTGKNKGLPKIYREDTTEPKLKWYTREFYCRGVVNLTKLPAEIREMFDGEFQGARKLVDGSPVYSTGADAIKVLSERKELSEKVRELMQALLEFFKADKDLGTYYLKEVKDIDGTVKKRSGMLQFVTEKNLIHHMLNNTATHTGRLSGTKPNLTNIPRGDTSEVKHVFTSRFNDLKWLDWAYRTDRISEVVYDSCVDGIESGNPQGRICEVDFGALEIVVLAQLTRDPALIQALVDGTDMHCMRVAKSLNEDYTSVLNKVKDSSHPDHKLYKKLRTDVKPKSFAFQYGATARGIAYSTGSTVEEAQAFIDTEKALFPVVESFFEQMFSEVEKTTVLDREMNDTGGFRMFGVGTYTLPCGTTFEFKQEPKTEWVNGQKITKMAYKPTQMRNYPVQGLATMIVQGVSGYIMRWLVASDFLGGRVVPVNTVHDSLCFEYTVDVQDELARVTVFLMTQVATLLKPLGYDIVVPFTAEFEGGLSLFTKSTKLV